jgi:putative transcriptional regulator
MTIRHHINDDLLLAYASGNLAEGWSLAVACHLAMCPECRRALAVAETTAGALMEDLAPITGPDDSWEQLKARLLAEPQEPAQPVLRPAKAVLPEPLRSYLGGDLDTLKWRSMGTAPRCPSIPMAAAN